MCCILPVRQVVSRTEELKDCGNTHVERKAFFPDERPPCVGIRAEIYETEARRFNQKS